MCKSKIIFNLISNGGHNSLSKENRKENKVTV